MHKVRQTKSILKNISTLQPLTVQINYSKKIKSQKYNNQDNFLINK